MATRRRLAAVIGASIGLLGATAEAATIDADSCDASAVQAAIDAAVTRPRDSACSSC